MEDNKNEKRLYAAMMQGMIEQLEKRNIKVIQACLDGYEQPVVIDKKKPDIIGINEDGNRIIVVVEDGKTGDREYIKERFIEFSKADGEFWVEVSESHSKELLDKVKEWRTPVNNWFVCQGI